MTTFRPQWQTADWVLCAVVVANLGSIAWFGGMDPSGWVPIALLLFFACLVVWWRAWRNGRPLPFSPLAWPMLGFGGLVTWQWLGGGSQYPEATLTGLMHLTACGCIFALSLLAFESSAHVRLYGRILWGFTGCLTILALMQYFTADRWVYWIRDASYAMPVGPFIYHNHYAGCLDMLLPVATAAIVLPARHQNGGIALLRRGLIPILALASLVVAQSRGGILVLGVELVLAVLVLGSAVRSRYSLLQVTSVAIFVGGFALLAGGQPLLQRFLALQYHDASAVDRLRVAKSCLAIWRIWPWSGSGFGSFSVIYPRFQTFDNGLLWQYAHNEYAQALAETGLIGMAMITTFLVILVRKCWRGLQTWADSTQWVRKAAVIGLAGFLVHSYGDFQFHNPANALLFFALAGMVVAPYHPVIRTPARRRSQIRLTTTPPRPAERQVAPPAVSRRMQYGPGHRSHGPSSSSLSSSPRPF